MRKSGPVLKIGASVFALTLAAGWTTLATAQEDQLDRYRLRLNTQIFDGRQEFSHSQAAGLSRVRHGDQSYVMIDYHDGAAVIERPNQLALGEFRNTSGIEAAFLYDYGSHQMSGENDVAAYFNRHIQPFMRDNPEPGKDLSWSMSVPLSRLGISGVGEGEADIRVSRKYFSHAGQELVLIQYDVPAFAYTAASGMPVIHWGRSAAILDATMGRAYWNATVHRAVGGSSIQAATPYRYTKTITMTDDKGRPVVDVREIPQAGEVLREYTGSVANEVIGFSPAATGDQSPVEVAVRLDMLGLALAENSGNQLPQITGQTATGNRGQEESNGPPGSSSTADSAATGTGWAVKLSAASKLEIKGKYEADKRALDAWGDLYVQKTTRLARDIAETHKDIEIIGEAISQEGALASEYFDLTRIQQEEMERANSLFRKPDLKPSEARQLRELRSNISARARQIETLEPKALAANGSTLMGDLVDDYNAAHAKLERLNGSYNDLLKEGESLAHAAAKLEARRVAIENFGLLGDNVRVTKSTFVDKLPAGLRQKIGEQAQVWAQKALKAADSADALLTTAGDIANAYNTAKAGRNVIYSATRNTASGNVNLVRNYGTGWSVVELGADIGGLVLSAATGDLRGFISDGVAITAGSLADIFVSAKALKDIHVRELEALKETRRIDRARYEQLVAILETNEARFEVIGLLLTSDLPPAEIDRLIDRVRTVSINSLEFENIRKQALGAQDPNALSDEELDRRAEENLEARRRERAELRERQRQEALERERRQDEIEAENERRRTAQDRFEDDIKPDYPTADPDQTGDERETQTADLPDSTGAEDAVQEVEDILMDESLDDAWNDPFANFDLEAYQKDKLDRIKAEHEAWLDSLGSDGPKGDPVGAGVTTYTDINGILHVRVTQIDETPPTEFDSPEWVPPEYIPPKTSTIDWTDFDDDDIGGTIDNLAFTFESMSGKVETSLEGWEDFIALYGYRNLERLALSAGYPNLASALADWENLVRQANDPGWVKWAQSAPSCGGYGGCGPNYLGRWSMKTSQLKLGRLLSDSRDVFSTAGLSDISIFGLDLSYVMRDFGVEDGDIVQLLVKQFGRTIFAGQVNLINAGEQFEINTRRGVVTVEITALNEGALSPNTAEIKIDNVAEGEATQSYNLSTGETATLRVETGR